MLSTNLLISSWSSAGILAEIVPRPRQSPPLRRTARVRPAPVRSRCAVGARQWPRDQPPCERHPSPYLLQHKDNPVDWWPWCDEAFAQAKRRDAGVPVGRLRSMSLVPRDGARVL